MEVFRNHNIAPEKEDTWSSAKATAKSPCHHATNFIIPDQTTGSLVSHIMKDIQVHWVTGSSVPCVSTFKPIFFPKPGLNKKLKTSIGLYDPDGFWWINEKFQRLVNQDYQQRLNVFKDERDSMEKEFINKAEKIMGSVSEEISEEAMQKMVEVSNDAFSQSIKKVKEWTNKIEKMPIQDKAGLVYQRYWNKQNKQAKLKL